MFLNLKGKFQAVMEKHRGQNLGQKRMFFRPKIPKTSSGASCICDYTNTKSPPYTLYTFEWCTLSGYMVLNAISIVALSATIKIST